MDEEDVVDCTGTALRSQWSVRLDRALTDGGSAAAPAMHGAGPGVRQLRWSAGEALVIGRPRSAVVPGTGTPDPDPALALLSAVEDSGVSGLRRMEGPWGLLRWDAERGELLAAVDRLGRVDIHVRQDPDGWSLAGSAAQLAAPDGTPIRRLSPGEHLQLRSDGSVHAGSHAVWQVERRDRRPVVLVVGEFEERLKSALRELAEDGELVLLAEDPLPSALLAAALAQLPGSRATLLNVPGLSLGAPAFWSSVSTHFHFELENSGALWEHAGLPGDLLGSPVAGQPGSAAGPSGWTALERWCRVRGAARRLGDRPLYLLSAAGFDQALPAVPPPWRSLQAWRGWRSDAPPRPGPIGEALANTLRGRWKPPLDAAVGDSGLIPAWPMLDETVAHFLANLTDRLRWGRPWSADLRRRIIRDLLPAELRAALERRSD